MNPIIHPSQLYSRLKLLPYQSAFAANNSRFKIGLWARQTGKDHTATAEAVIDCLYNPGTTWVIVAAGERQAIESLAKAKDWAEILKFDIDDYIEAPANLPIAKAHATRTEIKWSNGSRLIALPAHPPTVRGFTGSLILTEFAFNENADAIWGATFPYISNSIRGDLKKLRIISTPNGLNNKFADLWFNTRTLSPTSSETLSSLVSSSAKFTPSPINPLLAQSPSIQNVGAYFKSKLTIHDAIKRGLPLHADELRAGLNDEDLWSQEYLCEFMDTASVMFPYDLIAPCESEQALETNPQLSTINPQPTLFAGIDFGRKHHLTVCWILEAIPAPPGFQSQIANQKSQILVTREVLCLKNTSTPEQLEILRPRLQRCRKICLDYTGAGVGLGDYLTQEFGGGPRPPGAASSSGKVELCSFTPALKGELFPRLRAAFEQRSIRIPISREIREDLHAIQRTVSQHGQITYRAPHTPDGHSDRTTALALSLRAATSAPVSYAPTTVYVPGRSANLRWARSLPRISRRRRGGFFL